MRPKKKRAGPAIPDLSKEEVDERLGGTTVEATGDDERWEKGDEGDDAGYGRPQEQGVDDERI